jgi:hypothetical protein
MKKMKSKIILLLISCLSRISVAQTIHVIGNPGSCKKEIRQILSEVYFNKKIFNVSKVEIVYSFKDGGVYSRSNFASKVIPNKKNTLRNLDTILDNISRGFEKEYTKARITTAISNVKSYTSSYSKIMYVDNFGGSENIPDRWKSVKVSEIGLQAITKRELPVSTIVINGIRPNITATSYEDNVAIVLGSLLVLNGGYKMNRGKPQSLEYKINGIHDDWQQYESVEKFNNQTSSWTLTLSNLTKDNSIKVRIKAADDVVSNEVSISYIVVQRPKIELLFPINRGQLANCSYQKDGKQYYYMKLSSNVNPSYLHVRIRKNYSVLDTGVPTNDGSEITFDLNKTNKSQFLVVDGLRSDVYCLFIECGQLFRTDNNDKDAPCRECVEPYDMYSLEFKISDRILPGSEWTKPYEFSLVSFSNETPIYSCPCE